MNGLDFFSASLGVRLTQLVVTGPMNLTVHGNALVARHMFDKGKAFVGGAILMKRHNGNQAVVLHLLCQGVEILLKAGLLRVDYEKYRPKLRKFGHRLSATSKELHAATGLDVLPRAAGAELAVLERFYNQHLLRYGHTFDILVDYGTIPYKRVLMRIAAAVKLCERRGIFRT